MQSILEGCLRWEAILHELCGVFFFFLNHRFPVFYVLNVVKDKKTH